MIKIDKLKENHTPEELVLFFTKLVDKAHSGQMYGDKKYIYHLEHVNQTMWESVYDRRKVDGLSLIEMYSTITCACLGHDLIEDTECDEQFLLDHGVPKIVVDIIVAVTKFKGMSQHKYLENIKKNPLAVMVKTADSLSNLQHCLKDGRSKGVTKYTNVLNVLNGLGSEL